MDQMQIDIIKRVAALHVAGFTHYVIETDDAEVQRVGSTNYRHQVRIEVLVDGVHHDFDLAPQREALEQALRMLKASERKILKTLEGLPQPKA